MHKRYFLKLVHKHLNGKATVEEEQLLITYYNLFESEPDIIALLSDEEKLEIKSQMTEAIYDRIQTPNGLHNNIRWVNRWYVKLAAAVFLGGIISVTFFLSRPPFLNPHNQILSQKIDQENGNRLIRLPDGSTVIVMKDSKLIYSKKYNAGGKREVYLEGQGYFDVKHDAARPFVVHTGNLQTTVLGTAFNVQAMKGDNKIIVTVTRGKVSVGNKYKVFGTITPDQQMIFNKNETETVPAVKKVDADTYLSWKNQDLLFDDVTMEEASKLLKERFKIDIAFTDAKLMANRFTATFPHDEKLEYELDIICQVNKAVYTYDKEHAKVEISSKTN